MQCSTSTKIPNCIRKAAIFIFMVTLILFNFIVFLYELALYVHLIFDLNILPL